MSNSWGRGNDAAWPGEKSMSQVSVHIPQIGEGLQEARLVAVLKQPGDYVRRDEPIYQMETDKAVMDVESPYEGILSAWLHPVDTILPIGAEVARMDVGDGVAPAPTPHVASAPVEAAAAAVEPGLASVRIPQIGEGLQEARLVAVLKQPGDLVKRDEPIYQMETDKAVMDVESPYEGILVEWKAPVDTVLAIGAEVATMKVSSGTVIEDAPAHGATAPTVASGAPVSTAANTPIAGKLRNEHLSPRARAYAAAKGVSEADLAVLAGRGSRITEADIDALLSGGMVAKTSGPSSGISPAGGAFTEQSLNQKQRLLASRLVRGNQLVVPGTMTVAMNWEPVEALRNQYKAKGGDFKPSAFTMFAFACVKALSEFPIFRSSLKGDETMRTYEHVNLGVAVALPGDELVIAVVNEAEKLSWVEFAQQMRESIDLARNGKDQAHEGVTVSLTNMQHNGIRDAVAVVVPPAVATVFLGETYNGLAQNTTELKIQRCANLGITFDHRLINGVGAADFQNRIKQLVEDISTLISVA